MEAQAGEYFIVGQSVGTIVADPKSHWLRVNDATGAQSESSLVDDRLRTVVQGPVDVGTDGEPRVRDTLLSVLRSSGVTVSWEPGVNQDGEDGILVIASQRVTLQITTAPRDPSFWRDANTAPSAATDVAVDHAAHWVHDSLAHKAASLSTIHKAQMILAVDAAHFGPLASQEVVTSYVSQFGEPRQEFGFGAAYIVGPTPSSTTRLGTGRW